MTEQRPTKQDLASFISYCDDEKGKAEYRASIYQKSGPEHWHENFKWNAGFFERMGNALRELQRRRDADETEESR